MQTVLSYLICFKTTQVAANMFYLLGKYFLDEYDVRNECGDECNEVMRRSLVTVLGQLFLRKGHKLDSKH